MNKETEIKLSIAADRLPALREHPLLTKGNKAGWQRAELFNQYFDTPNQDLAQAKVALRIRKEGEHYIQTLKSRGASVAGLSERNEWEWPLTQAALDLSLLDDSCWPEALKDLDKTTLAPLFTTDFVREKAEIATGRGKTRLVIEAALDQGLVLAGSANAPICELELELKQGEPAALLTLAQALAQDIALLPCEISKAERGYRLANIQTDKAEQLPLLSADASLDAQIPALVSSLLSQSLRLAEHYQYSGHWKFLQDWLAQLIDLRALLASLGQAAPRVSTHCLREFLDQLVSHWRGIIHAATSEQDREAAKGLFTQELSQTRLGVLSLSCAQWLNQQSWMLERSARGNRQGAAALGNWLLHLLTDEAQALAPKRYELQPEDLAEQMPRMEKLIVWLRLARQLTELPEVNRLYGELRKLYELAQQPISDELLLARSAQAHTVWTLKAWKQLTR